MIIDGTNFQMKKKIDFFSFCNFINFHFDNRNIVSVLIIN